MKVKVRGNNIEGALRLFRRKVLDNGTIFQYKEKQYYEKASVKKQRAKAAAKAREQKRQNEG